jgi:formiminotetrahydrofolate cyclodeaminase
MTSFTDKSIRQFSEELASPAPVPGGGGASALIGAVGIALGDMVGELTVGKKKYADVEDEIRELMARAQKLRARFLELIDADAEAFAPLAAAYRIPKDAPGRAETMEKALHGAGMVPLEIMRASIEALEITEVFAEKGSRLAVSDAGCAAAACKAALQGAYLNVIINTKSMKDRSFAQELQEEADRLLGQGSALADQIYQTVADGLRG